MLTITSFTFFLTNFYRLNYICVEIGCRNRVTVEKWTNAVRHIFIVACVRVLHLVHPDPRVGHPPQTSDQVGSRVVVVGLDVRSGFCALWTFMFRLLNENLTNTSGKSIHIFENPINLHFFKSGHWQLPIQIIINLYKTNPCISPENVCSGRRRCVRLR